AAANPTQIAFPATAVGGHAATTFRVTNTAATGDLTIDSTVITGAQRDDFSDDFDDSGQVVLAPGASTTITVGFDPQAAAAPTATLTVHHSGPDPLTLPLSRSGA